MARFSISITATPEDIDILGHVNNAVWVKWVQDVATSHWSACTSAEEQAAMLWVVTRHEIDYRANISAGDTVIGETWISEPPRGARFNRNVRFLMPDGGVCVEAKTSWALIDAASKRLIRVPAALADRFLER